MNLLKATIASIVRKLLVVLFGFAVLPLVAGGWLTSELAAEIRAGIDSTAGLIAATILTLVVPLVWGWWEKVVAKAKLIVAAATPLQGAPAETVASEVAARVEELPAKQKLELATTRKDVR